MASDPYGDPDLVALYDLDNPDGPDHAFYRALADSLDAASIVDLGCGTGLLTRSLARPGRTVLGIDPSVTMLRWAQEQPGADQVTWVLGDATAIPGSGTVDLVTCTGNAFMHLDDDGLGDALLRAAAALRPGGVLAFETRNPAARAWEGWTREATWGQRETHLGLLTEWVEVVDVDAGRVTFEAHNVLPGGADRVFTTVLAFRDVPEITGALARAGFGPLTVEGGWRGEPVGPDARVLVVRATRL